LHNGTDYDVLIIGGGQAGIPLAYKLAGRDFTVALAERKDLGGSCVNFGCSPTKAAIASAKVAFQARRASEFGVEIPEVRVDFPAVLRRARGVAETKRAGLDRGLEGSENPVLIRGHARLEGREDAGFRVTVGERTLLVGQVVLNTGTRTLIPPIEDLETVDFIDSGNWMDREELPGHLAVVGGSYIGLEMAQFYRRMGSDVTVVVGSSDHVTSAEDDDVSEAMRGILAEEGVRFVFCERARKVAADGDGLTLALDGEDPAEVRATHLFLATGRRPNTDDLGLENVGIEADERGFIQTDERLSTDVEGIWAGGDIRGGYMFTHTSYDDHRVLLSQMAGDGRRTTDRVVPYGIFTDPELGRVGMTEREAREAGHEVEIHRLDMEGEKGKAFELGENKGFIKVVADAATDRVLGAAVLTVEGAELVHIYEDLMNADQPLSVVREAVYVHPTIAEDIQSAI
jgi:pyruvate/2-oxoglutarate dehydrogenase complex dihydrolipoamide dehydrogenase (E3) component